MGSPFINHTLADFDGSRQSAEVGSASVVAGGKLTVDHNGANRERGEHLGKVPEDSREVVAVLCVKSDAVAVLVCLDAPPIALYFVQPLLAAGRDDAQRGLAGLDKTQGREEHEREASAARARPQARGAVVEKETRSLINPLAELRTAGLSAAWESLAWGIGWARRPHYRSAPTLPPLRKSEKEKGAAWVGARL